MKSLLGWPVVETDLFTSNSVPSEITFTDLAAYIVPIKVVGKKSDGIVKFTKPDYLNDAEWDAIIDALAKSAGSLE